MQDEPHNERKEQAKQELAKLIEPHLQSIGETLLAIGKLVESIKTQAIPFFEQLAKIDWKALQARLESMPKLSREAMKTASEQGWFFNLQSSMEETFEVIEGLQNATSDQIDEILSQHFTKNIDWYTEILSDLYPERKSAIESAVCAHKNKEYNGYFVSIPVFLAQADGLLSQISKTPSAMDKKDGVIKGSIWVKGQIGDDQEAADLLNPILKLHELDLLKSQKIRESESLISGKSFNALNRHQVMHGEVSDYGSEINSLKALSFLVFVGLHIPHVIEDMNNRMKWESKMQPQ
ncbi:hypothetical protein [Pseudomonas sp. GM17]|uniref:hypothetical protein n=1 Tax=Pseudomonas sp. GM17 TaxID=1144323 RepID=UPI0002727766|nr:hypothetical protein [Pseudomonas sp. GM17]WIE52405.1 hypothetical protein PMI20_012650 [Pseudomonas sp. GM17]